MPRTVVGGFQHETHTFAPQRATWADFARADAWPGYVPDTERLAISSCEYAIGAS
jgi:microcystin degradation protein MlrC